MSLGDLAESKQMLAMRSMQDCQVTLRIALVPFAIDARTVSAPSVPLSVTGVWMPSRIRWVN